MDTPMQVNGSRDPFPIPFRKFFNLWTDVHEKVMEITTMWGSLRLAPIIDTVIRQEVRMHAGN